MNARFECRNPQGFRFFKSFRFRNRKTLVSYFNIVHKDGTKVLALEVSPEGMKAIYELDLFGNKIVPGIPLGVELREADYIED